MDVKSHIAYLIGEIRFISNSRKVSFFSGSLHTLSQANPVSELGHNNLLFGLSWLSRVTVIVMVPTIGAW
jgi:hypothetical protein